MPDQKTTFNRNNKTGARRAQRHRRTIRWSAAAPESLRAFVDGITADGNAVMFGRTADGGALSLLILSGNEKYREYISAPEDITPLFAELLEDFATAWLPADPEPPRDSA